MTGRVLIRLILSAAGSAGLMAALLSGARGAPFAIAAYLEIGGFLAMIAALTLTGMSVVGLISWLQDCLDVD